MIILALNAEILDEKFIKEIKTYTPQSDPKGTMIGKPVKLFTDYYLVKKGEVERESGVRLNVINRRVKTESGEIIIDEEEIGEYDLNGPSVKPFYTYIKFFKNGNERWIEIRKLWVDGKPQRNVNYIQIRNENLTLQGAQLFDSGDIINFYLGTLEFNHSLGVFCKNYNFRYYDDQKPEMKDFIEACGRHRNNYNEQYSKSGHMTGASFMQDSDMIWLQYFYENGRLKTHMDNVRNIDVEFDQSGKVVKFTKY